ncbi:hemerythrin [Azospirillum fermentarium]|uniref:bacteriohemerythrin n=1 Tax=Azospirillum fermentarium TaxID=1233114 RepID=UPI0022278AD8|nr:hemerythrin family protein [Azospirillum fermentarium]MCW2247127.1 hemerythrin [Azospirillum fermentarium]
MEWNEAYAIGPGPVDQDHQKLFHLFNQFSDALATGDGIGGARRFLDELMDYSRYHFQREEALMRGLDYPDYAKHKRMHDGFADFVRKTAESMGETPDDAAFLQNYVEMWLCGHILVMDKWFGEWLAARGQAGTDTGATA